MNKQEMLQKLSRAVRKYGEQSAASSKNVELQSKDVAYDSMEVDDINILHVREALIRVGKILEEDIEYKTHISTIPTGAMKAARALAVTVLDDHVLYIAAYAKEGLIKQNLAKHAIETIKQSI